MFQFIRQLRRDRFAQRILRAIVANGGPTDLTYDRAYFMLRSPNLVMNLANVYQSYSQAQGEQRRRIFDNFALSHKTGAGTELSSFAHVEAKLVAVVRERAFLAAMEGPGWGLEKPADPQELPAHDPFSQWFSRALVIDFPTHVAVVNHSHLKSWNRTFDEAFALGLEKLRNATSPRFRRESGYYVGTWDDDFDSSRILIHSLFDDLPLNGEPVVTLPNRLHFMVAGSNDHAAVRAMLAKAETIVRDQPKPQNVAPLVVRDGQIFDFRVDASSPIFNDVERARKYAALVTYEDQKANLERHFERIKKDDVFVAKFILSQTPSGGYESHSVWSNGVPTLLPITDTVFFYDERRPEADRIVCRASWKSVNEVLGEVMLDTKMFPLRYFVSQFPSDAQVDALASSTSN